jgi:thymidylate kinase
VTRLARELHPLDPLGARFWSLEGLGEVLGEADVLAAGYLRVPARGHGTHRFYRAYDAEHDAWIELDVAAEVAFGRYEEYATEVASDLLARRSRNGDLWQLDPDDVFWHVVLHDLLRRGAVAAYRRERVTQHARAWRDGPLARLLDDLAPGSPARLLQAAAAGDERGLRAAVRVVRRGWLRRDPLGVPVRALATRAARHVPAAPRGRGLSLAVLGPDGAGKTTLADGLRATVPMPSTYVYLGIWRQSGLGESLRRVVGARLAIRLVRLLAKSLLITIHRRQGKLVLLDRHTCDADLPAADLDLKGRVSAALVRRTCAEPDLVLLLDAPVELMYARKGEHGVEELELRREAYLSMRDGLRDMVVLDAAKPAEEVRRHATAILWDRWTRARLDRSTKPARSAP